MSEQEMLYIDDSVIPKNAKEIISAAFSKVTKKVATMDFSKITNTSSTYSKEQLISSLEGNEQTDVDTLVQFSNHAYRRYGEYKQLINRFAGVHRFRNYIVPGYSFSDNKDDKIKSMDIATNYIRTAQPTESMRDISRRALLDGVAYVYFNEVENKQCLQFLPSDYCRTRTFDSYGNHIVEMNMKYFESEYTDDDERELVLKQLPKELSSLYKNYQNANSNIGDEQHPEWQQLDPDFACAFQFGEDSVPYFSALFPDLLDLQEYKNMAKLDSQLDLFGLLVQKTEFNDDGNLDVDEDTFEGLQLQLAKIAKTGGLGALTTPYTIEALKLKDNQSIKQDYVAQGISNLYNAASLSESEFNSNKSNGGAMGITSSNQMLTGVFDNIISQFKRWYSKKINMHTGNVIYDFVIMDITCFNEKDKVASYKDQLGLANGSWLAYCSALGIESFNAYSMVKFEDEIGLKELLKPLVTSYTSSANSDNEKPSDDNKNVVQKDNATNVNRTSKENK